MSTDTKFFTNESGQTLLDRFKVSLKNNTQYFDVLVWYFRASGFYELYKELEDVEKIRVLVWLNVDQWILDMINQSQQQKATKEIKDDYSNAIQREFSSSEDSKEFDEWVTKFIEFIENDKLEIRVYPKEQIHAKIYIIRKNQEVNPEYYGSVITWSSNFSFNGLRGNMEFNVELKDRRDVEYALEKFEPLRQDGVDVSQQFVDTVKTKTHLDDSISPYELYLKFLYEYFWNLVNRDRNELELKNTPDRYQELEYQKDAVKETLHKIDKYWWVFLADVVWLGKTIVSCLLLQHLNAKALIICPPHIKEQWERDLREFMIWWAKVESLWVLDRLLREWTDDFEYVFIDEAHRFRNEDTWRYDELLTICQWKKVVLVSATPFNNKFDDLKNLIKLFHPLRNSSLPGIVNLESHFNNWEWTMKNIDINEEKEEYQQALKITSSEMRTRVLQHLMVRRTRSDIKKYYADDIANQWLKFPDTAEPVQVFYQLDEHLDQLFDTTLEKIAKFHYARYSPVNYLVEWAMIQASDLQIQRVWQRNIVWFMRTWLVKRLESSFFAFRNTLWRIRDSYESFIQMYQNGDVYVSKKVDVYDLLESDMEKLIQLVDEEKVVKYDKDYLTKEIDWEWFLQHLEEDLATLNELCDLRDDIPSDPKIDELILRLQTDMNLKDKQVILFSESKETVQYLEWVLRERLWYTDEVYAYSSENSSDERDMVRRSYDPQNKNPEDKIKILLTTDVLAEWINLHRSNVIINYDIPWNPTRVLQRVWRINRVGTKHTSVFVYNFFPTQKADEVINLEKNVIAKMEKFVSLLWADAKHLSEEVLIESKTLFDKLSSAQFLESEWWEETGNEHLDFLKELRIVRDSDPELFNRIKKLPKKSRSSRKIEEHTDKLLTFFKQDDYLKFYLSDMFDSQELAFEDAALLMKCDPDTKRESLDIWTFYELLSRNKDGFRSKLIDNKSVEESHKDKWKWVKIRKNAITFMWFLLQQSAGMIDEEESYFLVVHNLLLNNVLPLQLVRSINDVFDKYKPFENPTKVYHEFKNLIHLNYINSQTGKKRSIEVSNDIEVILSEYFI